MICFSLDLQTYIKKNVGRYNSIPIYLQMRDFSKHQFKRKLENFEAHGR